MAGTVTRRVRRRSGGQRALPAALRRRPHLLALWSGPGDQTVGELGRRLRLDSGTLTPLLKRLETGALVGQLGLPLEDGIALRSLVDRLITNLDAQPAPAGGQDAP